MWLIMAFLHLLYCSLSLDRLAPCFLFTIYIFAARRKGEHGPSTSDRGHIFYFMSKHSKFNLQLGREHCFIELLNYACQVNNIVCSHSIIQYSVNNIVCSHSISPYPAEQSSQINIRKMGPLRCVPHLAIKQAGKQKKTKSVVTKVR